MRKDVLTPTENELGRLERVTVYLAHADGT